MTATPDSFSMDELSAALENAPQEEEAHANENVKHTPELIEKLTEEALDSLEHLGPLGHKVAMMKVCVRMIAWHSRMAERHIKDDEIECGICWARDAGKFQSMMDSLTSISVGDDDFTYVNHAE